MPPMKLTDFLWAGVLSLLPISELRGGIPYAMTVGGAPWWLAYLYCVGMNALAAPIAFVFLNTAHRLLYRLGWYKRIFDRFLERSRGKVAGPVEKYGYWGLMVFVAIPLPLTGAWTGALGAWILGMKTRKSIAYVILGVAVAGVVVTAIMALGIKGFDLFLKRA
jgi:uncharacterized membrane protein